MKGTTMRALRSTAVITALAGLTLVACGSDSKSTSTTTAPAAAASTAAPASSTPTSGDALNVTIFASLAPLSFHDDSGKPTGFMVDIVNAAAKRIGRQADFHDVAFENVIPGIQSGQFDIGTGVDVTAEREAVLDLVPVAQAGYTFIVKADHADIGTDMKELCGMTIGGTKGQSSLTVIEDLSKDCVADGKPAIEVKTFPQPADVVLAVKSGNVDARSTWQGYASWLVKQDPELKVTGPVYSVTPTGLAVATDSPLGPQLVEAINAMISDGTYAEIMKNWESSDIMIDKTEVDPK
ncbi:MAG: transporter substrate-binding domain-containing protein [Ilumatobacteraceae bacterium]